MNIALTLLAFYGVTFALRSATLLEPPRLWLARRSRFARDLLGCPYCTGAYAGGITYAFAVQPLAWLNTLFLYVFAAAALSYVLDHAAQLLELQVRQQQLQVRSLEQMLKTLPPAGDHHEVMRPPP